jgi:hypothetical protein
MMDAQGQKEDQAVVIAMTGMAAAQDQIIMVDIVMTMDAMPQVEHEANTIVVIVHG